jgi:hypothetical protein
MKCVVGIEFEFGGFEAKMLLLFLGWNARDGLHAFGSVFRGCTPALICTRGTARSVRPNGSSITAKPNAFCSRPVGTHYVRQFQNDGATNDSSEDNCVCSFIDL